MSFCFEKEANVSIATKETQFVTAICLLIGSLCLPLSGASMSYRITRLTSEQALSESHVFCILQDRAGFMWFGTRDGLNRYDGYEMKVFRNDPADATSLSDNYIRVLWEDVDGMLWIGTRGGLNQFDPVLQTFRRFRNDPQNPNSLSHDTVESIIADRGARGGLWIGTSGGGLNHLDPQTGKFVRYRYDPLDPNSFGNDSVLCLTMDGDGTLWAGTQGGLIRMAPDMPGHFTRFTHESAGLSHNRVGGLYCDKQGTLWVGSNGGLDRLAEDGSFVHIFSPSENRQVTRIHAGPAQGMWLGTNRGIVQFSPEKGVIGNLLSERFISAIFADRGGSLWVGHYGSGISQMTPTPFTANPLPDEEVNCLLRDRHGDLWIGKRGKGIERRVSQGVDTYYPVNGGDALRKGTVKAMLEDSQGNLWAGTEKLGLVRLDRQAGRFIPVSTGAGESPKRSARDLLEDGLGFLWIATNNGLYRMNLAKPGVFEVYRPDGARARSLSDGNIACLHGDRKGGTLWVGTWNGGLNRVDLNTPGEFSTYRHLVNDPTSLSADAVLSIYEDEQNILWVGTSGGFNRFDPTTGNSRSFFIQDGLPSNTIYCILPDDEGQLWLSTTRGLSRFDPIREVFRNYDRFDGLPVNDFREGCGFLDRDQTMYFGGAGGFVSFSSRDIVLNAKPPQIAITELFLDNQAVRLKQEDPLSPLDQAIEATTRLELSYLNRSLELHFASLHYASPEKNRYSHRLEGYEDGWIETGANNRRVTYMNLRPKTYRFHVKGSTKDGIWGEARTLVLVVPPPPWRTWWAYSLYGLSFLSIIIWYVVQQNHKLALQRAAYEKEQLLVERLRETDRLKDDFMANTSHELRTPLHGMIGLAESLMEDPDQSLSSASQQDLAMIVSSGKRLGYMVNDLLDFAKIKRGKLKLYRHPVDLYALTNVVLNLLDPLSRSQGIHMENAVPGNLGLVLADEDRLQQILYNLVGNAVKFTKNGSVKVTASKTGKEVVIRVIDTGIGIAKSDLDRIFISFEQADGSTTRTRGGTGLGLALCKQLVELHGGSIDVSSQPGLGSQFSFVLPRQEDSDATVTEQEAVSVAAESEAQVRRRETEPVRQESAEPETDRVVALRSFGADRPFRILVVDDDPVNRRVLINHLSHMGHQVGEASEGETALTLIEARTYDLVLLDIMMPKLSGYEVCKRIRSSLSTHQLPIIFLTARGRTEDLITGFAVGGNDYLIKPFSKEELTARLGLHFGLIKAKRTLADQHQSMLLQDKMSSLGILTAGIGHEISNPVHFVNVTAENMGQTLKDFHQLLLEMAGEDPAPDIKAAILSGINPLSENVKTIQGGIQRITGILQNLRTFSYDGGNEVAPVDLVDCLQSTLNLVRPNFKKQVHFHVDCAEPVVVPGRQMELSQVFLNLSINACHAILSKLEETGCHTGKLLIKTDRQDNWGLVQFQDSGAGIPEKIREHIFEPFFTTKDLGEGTGLGLPISNGIIESHGGRIEVDSTLGQGTTFTVYLPIGQKAS